MNDGVDLAAARRNIRIRQGRWSLASEAADKVSERSLKVVVHCDDCNNRLASVYDLPDGTLLFGSKIAYRANDFYRPPPWFYDEHLRGVVGEEFESDSRLAGHLRLVAEPVGNDREAADRWLRSRPPARILDLLELPPHDDDPWVPDLWLRCEKPKHAMERADRGTLMRLVRAARVLRRANHVSVRAVAQRSG